MKRLILLMVTSVFAFTLSAAESSSELLMIQKTWAKTNYQLQDDEQEEQFEALLVSIDEQINLHPEQAEFWVWKGIIQSSFAGAKGGLGALSLAKKARKSLQKALALDDAALQGSAYTSLGTLYHKVPGWPLGFGDDDEAKLLLEKALKLNPDGIDPNYFYGEYLYDNKEYKGAMKHLETALNAPQRVDRPLADSGRRTEIESLLAQVKKRMDKNS
jgi:tetratricopeptide (TPR) repeat protein